MSKPEKPVFNPFAKSPASEYSDAKSGMAQKPERAVSIEALQARYRKGISLVGTEERLHSLSMRRATGLSAFLHVVSPVALTAIVLLFLLFLSWIMRFNFWDLFKSQQKPDIQFTLVKDTKADRPDNPKFKGNFNQKAGGKPNKRQPLKAVEEPPQSSPAKKAEPPKKQTPPQKPQPQQKAEPKVEPPQKAPEKKPTPEKTPEKPAVLPTIPKPAKAETKKQETGPVAKTQTASAAKASSQAKASQQASQGTAFTGSSIATASTGNPQKGKETAPGVDVAQDTDFGPFMADLEKRIKRNWSPPRGAESRKVVLMLFIGRDGKVVKIDVKKSSGDPEADDSARQAVTASAPFMLLPPQFKEDILPVEFAFDYNVLNPKNPKQALKW